VARLAARLEQPDLEHLARVVPLVHGGVDVEALVALQADQLRVEAGRKDLRQFGLSDPGLALEEQRSTELEREEDGGREGPVRDVVVRPELVLDRLDGAGARRSPVAVSHRPPMLHVRPWAGVRGPLRDLVRVRWAVVHRTNGDERRLVDRARQRARRHESHRQPDLEMLASV
jgi:hypothetical protein